MIEKIYRACAVIIIACGLVAIGAVIGYVRNKPTAIIQESHAASVVQSDGSIILERAPSASAVAPMKIPKGAKVERVVKVTVKHKPVASQVDCAPVTLDLALVRQTDDTRRVIASSPDGVIIGGMDIPISAHIAPVYKWATGASYDSKRNFGVWVDRDIGRVRIGIAVRQSDSGANGEVKLGWRF